MFTVMINDVEHKVFFTHKSKIMDNGQRRPTKTLCSILVGDKKVSESVAKPIDELAVITSSAERAEAMFRRRLKRILTAESGEVVAILKGDHFSYQAGRKVALGKALEIFDNKADRTRVWEAFYNKQATARAESKAKLEAEQQKTATTKTL